MSNSGFLRISEASALALHTMYYLSTHTDGLVSTKEIASTFNISENHLAKVLQRLVKVRLVDSIRGPKGGFNLAKDSQKITLLDIFEAIEGRAELDDCLLHQSVCGGGKECVLFNGLIEEMNSQIQEHMKNKKLSDLKNLFN